MPEPKMEVDMDQIKNLNIDINQRVRFFDHPFAYQVTNKEVEKFCSYCMRRPDSGKLMYCSNCRFVRYCDKACQKQHWKVHKIECRRLMKVFPNLPLTDVLFLSKIIDRVLFIREHGDTHGWQKDRKFEDLMSHDEDIKKDPDRMKLFETQYEKLQKFWKDDPLPEREDLFLLFCRTWINSHSIHNSGGTEIGLALDLGVSLYNHSCKANGALVFDGFRAMIRPLTPKLDAADWQKTTISYIDIGKSRFVRRKELKRKWYFLCECERCMDVEEETATAIRCINDKCKAPIMITEDSEVMNIACDECKTITPDDRVKGAQDFMLTMPTSFSMDPTPENIESLKKLLEEAKAVLHKDNIYYSRLLTAYYYVTEGKSIGGDDEDMHKLVYENYRRCFPKADRHVGYQLINLVRTLVENDKRDEAVQYAYEAMTIFEICFGLSHPFYLQILALWTFLDTGADKTKEELFRLMVFHENKPIDINPFLAKAEALAQQLAGLNHDQQEEGGQEEAAKERQPFGGRPEKFYVPPDADAEAAKTIPTLPTHPEGSETLLESEETAATSDESVSTTTEPPVTATKEPVTATKEPVTATKEPVTATKESVTVTKESVTGTKQPVATPATAPVTASATPSYAQAVGATPTKSAATAEAPAKHAEAGPTTTEGVSSPKQTVPLEQAPSKSTETTVKNDKGPKTVDEQAPKPEGSTNSKPNDGASRTRTKSGGNKSATDAEATTKPTAVPSKAAVPTGAAKSNSQKHQSENPAKCETGGQTNAAPAPSKSSELAKKPSEQTSPSSDKGNKTGGTKKQKPTK